MIINTFMSGFKAHQFYKYTKDKAYYNHCNTLISTTTTTTVTLFGLIQLALWCVGRKTSMRKSARSDAVVGCRSDLQCSVGAVNRLALYLRRWKLPMRSATVYLHEEVNEESWKYVAFECLTVCLENVLVKGSDLDERMTSAPGPCIFLIRTTGYHLQLAG